jgi:flavin-dependent dehydrogenase
MDISQFNTYDVVIMGAGFAGLCQARHLLLNLPNIKIALIDPRPEKRTDNDLKVGESLVEVSSLFVGKELGLYEYMIENHTPKSGLNFHWAKHPSKTDSLEDYFSVWNNRQPSITTFHLNRATFEQDVLQMNKKMGAVFYQGNVVDVDLTPQDELTTITVKLTHDNCITLKAKHVIDAAGRKFIIGRKTDNLIFHQADAGKDAENLYGLNNGSAWLRVRNLDRTLFHDGYDPSGAATSHYYATNHYFGQGHWLWMIPTSTNPLELSIGIMHHHQVIPANTLNSLDKFEDFLQANHTILHNLIMSGEIVDFHYLPRPAHSSKVLFSQDNWYVLGDAACIFDAFYSLGATMIAFAIESVTEIIRAKLAQEADAEVKRAVYNQFNLAFVRNTNGLYRNHAQQLGHASVMSWRIYFEYMWWFGMILPLFIGKWHLDIKFAQQFSQMIKVNTNGFMAEVYDRLTELVEKGANIGLLEAYQGHQLFKDYHPSKRFDLFLENAKYEPQHCNVYGGIKATYFYVALWYAQLQWKGFGWSGLFAPRTLYYLAQLLGLSAYTAIGEFIYRFQTLGQASNTEVVQMRQVFQKYRYKPQLQPWIGSV